MKKFGNFYPVKSVAYLILIFLFYGCDFRNEEEKKLESKLEQIFECDANLEKGVSSSTEEGDRSYYRITLSGYDHLPISDYLSSSLAAFWTGKLISNLDEYTHVYVVTEAEEFEFEVPNVIHAVKAENPLTDILELLKNRNYEALHNLFYSEFKNSITPEKLRETFEEIIESREINSFEVHGFDTLEEESNGVNLKLMRFYVVIILDNIKLKLVVVLNNPNDGKIYGLQLKNYTD